MKILILGAGQVGGSLATNLSSDGYEVTVVDEDSDKLADLDDSVDLRTVLGHASHPLTLRKAGCDKDTVLLSLTNNDENSPTDPIPVLLSTGICIFANLV